jgi:hypothetical protein
MANTKFGRRKFLAGVAATTAACATNTRDTRTVQGNLLAHWPLIGDCRDVSGNNHHGTPYGITFDPAHGARFDGNGTSIDIPHHANLDLGDRDFTLALRTHTADALEDTLGDPVSKWDADSRTGFNLGFMHYSGVTSSQPNHRHLQFGLDDGSMPNDWEWLGQPGNNQMVWAMCSFDGSLYAGVYEPGEHDSGRVYRLTADGWLDCGAPHGSNAVTSLAEYRGLLYAGVGHYRARGSALTSSKNTEHGGRVYRYAGGSNWIDCGRIAEAEAVFGLVAFGSDLFATSMYSPGLYRYDGRQGWIDCGHPGGRVGVVTAWNNALYLGGYDADYGGVFRYTPDGEWYDCGGPPETTQTYSFAVYGAHLYAGTWPSGKVFRYEGNRNWRDCGRLGEETEVMGMAVYNGALYAGTLPTAQVYRYDDEQRWTLTGRLDWTPDVKYRRAWTMAVHAGALHCGTLPSGTVHRFSTGLCVTSDRSIPSGRRHVAALRRGDTLELYVDGEQLAVGSRNANESFGVATTAPLRIGTGPHDNFKGAIRDVRLYDRALAPEEIAALAAIR